MVSASQTTDILDSQMTVNAWLKIKKARKRTITTSQPPRSKPLTQNSRLQQCAQTKHHPAEHGQRHSARRVPGDDHQVAVEDGPSVQGGQCDQEHEQTAELEQGVFHD